MKKQQDYTRGITPYAECEWAHIVKAKEPFQGKGDPKYEITLVWGKDNVEMQKWAGAIKEECRTLKASNCPIKKHKIKNDDGEKEEDGLYCVTFKTGVTSKPSVVNMQKDSLDGIEIGNGSIVRVSYASKPFTAFGGGLAMYLNAVQVKELVEFTKRNDFPDEDDGEVAPF